MSNELTSAEAQPSGFSRRALLQGGGAASLAMLLASPLFAGSANAATPAKRNQKPHKGRATHPANSPKTKRRPRPQRVLDANGNLMQPTPYYAQASCELSEDVFQTAAVVLQGTDQVLPFTAPSGLVEAVVLTGGAVWHLRRDSSQTSGWSYSEIPVDPAYTNLSGPVAKAAVQTDADGTAYLACLQQFEGGTSGAFGVYRLDPSGSWNFVNYTETDSYQFDDDTPLRAQLATDGNAAFYLPETSGVIHVWHLDAGNLLEFVIRSLVGKDLGDLRVIFDPTAGTGTPVAAGAVVLQSDGNLVWYRQTGATTLATLPQDIGGNSYPVTDLVWVGAPIDPQDLSPALVYQMPRPNSDPAPLGEGDLYYTDSSGNTQGLGVDYGDSTGPGTAAVWRQDGLSTFAFLDDNGLLSVVGLYRDEDGNLAYSQPIPLQNGLNAVYAQPSDPDQATLFVIDATLSLSVLAKDSTGAWSLTPVCHDTTDDNPLVEIDSWRVQISLYDANDAPLSAGQFELSADHTVGCWQEPTGSFILGPDPITLTADAGGQCTFSVPATELDTAVMSVQVLDGNGSKTNTFTINPHLDVHQFLAGEIVLSSAGSLSRDTLLQAKGSDGTALFGNLVSSADPAGTADTFVNAFNTVAKAGLGYVPGDNDPQSYSYQLSGALGSMQSARKAGKFQLDLDALNTRRKRALAHRRSSRHTAGGGTVGLESVNDWWDSVKHDADSVFHAMRHGLMTVDSMVINWEQDAQHWVVNMVVDLGDDIAAITDLVIHDVETATHAIANFFHTLGADIKAAVEWLKHHVLDLLKHTDANARVLLTYLSAAGPHFTDVMNRVQVAGDGFFSGLSKQAHQAIAKLAKDCGDTTFGDQPSTPPPSDDTGSKTAEVLLKDLKDVNKIIRFADGQWLIDKFKKHQPTNTDLPTNPDVDDPIAAIEALLTDDVITLFTNVGELLFTSAELMFPTSAEAEITHVSEFFTELDKVIDDVLTLLDHLFDAILDLMKAAVGSFDLLLNHELEVPYIGELLKLAGAGAPKLTVGYLVCLVAAFPATLATDIQGKALFPADSQSGGLGFESVESVDDPWGCALNWLSMGTQGFWTVIGMYEDANVAEGKDNPDGFYFVDIVAPLLLTVLQWPSTPVDGKTPPPLSDVDWGGPDGPLIITTLVAAIAPAFADSAETTFARKGGQEYKNSAFATYFQPIVQCISGVVGIVTASLTNWDSDASDAMKAAGIMGGMSYAFAPLALKVLNDATEGVPLEIKWWLDIMSGGATAVCFSDQAISND